MAKRQRDWARKVRDWLFVQLGRKCKTCGATVQLEFDLIIPANNTDHHRKMEWSWRMSFYRREFHKQNLQVLCDKCNGRKQNQLKLVNTPEIDEPF